MEKIWTSTEKKDTSVVIITDDILYFGKLKEEEINDCLTDFKLKIISKKLFSLPIAYLIKVSMQEEHNSIELYYRGNTTDELNISDVNKRNEIFSHLKTIRPDANYSSFVQTRFQACKKPLIALSVTTLIFIWTLFYLMQLDAGYQYEIVGNPGIGGIALGIASLGMVKVLCVFIPLILIALFMTLKKARTLATYHIILFGK